MKKAFLFFSAILVATIFLNSCGGNPSLVGTTYYAGYEYDPDQFYFNFQENGKIKICQDKGNRANCCSDGQYKQNSDGSFTISGISNPNCNFMSELNGTYELCADCIPANKGYKKTGGSKGILRAWPEKE